MTAKTLFIYWYIVYHPSRRTFLLPASNHVLESAPGLNAGFIQHGHWHWHCALYCGLMFSSPKSSILTRSCLCVFTKSGGPSSLCVKKATKLGGWFQERGFVLHGHEWEGVQTGAHTAEKFKLGECYNHFGAVVTEAFIHHGTLTGYRGQKSTGFFLKRHGSFPWTVVISHVLIPVFVSVFWLVWDLPLAFVFVLLLLLLLLLVTPS